MHRRIVLGVALLCVWLGFVFLVTLRLTFPSEAVADRLAYEVQKGSGGQYELQLRDLSPWRLGATADAIRLFRHAPGGGEPTLAFAADSARVKVGAWSLLRRQPRLTGTVRIGSGDVDFVVSTGAGGAGPVLHELLLEAPKLPLADVAMLAGADLEGTGSVNLQVRLLAPEGFGKADGQVTITGRDLRITRLDLSSAGVPDLGMEIPIQDLELTLDVKAGKATITRGNVRTGLGSLRVEGEINLRDDLASSILNIGLLVGDLGEELKPFQGFLGTPWRDGKFHYRCTGSFERSNCREERERDRNVRTAPNVPVQTGTRAAPPVTDTTRMTPTSAGAPVAGPVTGVPGAVRPSTERPGVPPRMAGEVDDEERSRRREELRERLRERRQEMRARRSEDRADVEDEVDDEEEFDEALDEDDDLEEEF